MRKRFDPFEAERAGFAAGSKVDPDAPENGYLLCGKTALAVAREMGYRGEAAQSFGRGYLMALDQLVRM